MNFVCFTRFELPNWTYSLCILVHHASHFHLIYFLIVLKNLKITPSNLCFHDLKTNPIISD